MADPKEPNEVENMGFSSIMDALGDEDEYADQPDIAPETLALFEEDYDARPEQPTVSPETQAFADENEVETDANEASPLPPKEEIDLNSSAATDIAVKTVEFSEDDDEDIFTEFEIGAREEEERLKAKKQQEPEEMSLMEAMTNFGVEAFTEEDEQALEREQQKDKEADFYSDGGEYLPTEVRETLKTELEKKASEELAKKIAQHPLEVFTEQDLEDLENEEANRNAARLDDKNAIYDTLYNDKSIIGAPPTHIGESLDTDTINALRGNTNEAQEPPPSPPPPKEEAHEEDEPKEDEEKQPVASVLDLNNGKIEGYHFVPKTFEGELDPNKIGTGEEDPMLAFMGLLKSMGDDVAEVSSDYMLFKLNQMEAKMDAGDFSLEKPTKNNITTDTGSTEVDGEDIVVGLSYWLIYANRMAKNAEIGGENLLTNDIITLSVAENKMHQSAWRAERDNNIANWNFTASLKNSSKKSNDENPKEQTEKPKTAILSKTKNAFFMAVAAVSLGEYGKRAFNPQRRKETIVFPELIAQGMKAAQKGNMEELKDFVRKTDAIMEELQANVAAKLGLPEDHTAEDLQRKAQDSDNPAVQSCVDSILAYTRGTLIAEKHFLKEELISNSATLKQEANRRDALMQKGGIDKNITRANTDLSSPRDLIRSAATRAEASGGLDDDEGFHAFKTSLPKYAQRTLSKEEIKELGKLSIKTDADIKAVMSGKKGLGIAEETIQQITKSYFPEAKNLQQGIAEQQDYTREVSSLLSPERRTEIAKDLTEGYKDAAENIQNQILEDAIASQTER